MGVLMSEHRWLGKSGRMWGEEDITGGGTEGGNSKACQVSVSSRRVVGEEWVSMLEFSHSVHQGLADHYEQ